MRSKLFRIGLGAGLAVFIGVAGVFAGLAVLPRAVALAESESFSTEAGGLIVPKADDPVVFTTASGIDIKFGNNLPDTYGDSLGSGNLKGFPYFTTTSGSTTYTWVIIGQGLDMSGVKGKHEIDDSPAGIAIKNDPKFDLEIIQGFVNDITESNEIDDGSVLVLANECVATGVFNTSYARDSYYPYGSGCWNGVYAEGYNSDIKVAMNGYYSNGSFGLSAIKSQIKTKQIKTYTWAFYSFGNAWKWTLETTTANIFPLCCTDDSNGSTFTWSKYLTSSQIKLSVNQWVRGGGLGNGNNNAHQTVVNNRVYYCSQYINTSGNDAHNNVNSTCGYRPAFVMSLV